MVSNRRRRELIVVLLALGAVSGAVAQRVDGVSIAARDGGYRLRTLVAGLEHPWAIAPLDGGGALITERGGTLWYLSSLEPGRGALTRVDGVPRVWANGQGGLLDVIAPGEGTVYLTYAEPAARGGRTAVARARLFVGGTSTAPTARLSDLERIFAINTSSAREQHFGSRVVLGEDGFLYVSVGDRGEPESAQNAANHAGTIVRIAPDGSIPADNPTIPGGAPGIVSFGHRNPQGMALHPQTGAVWVHEHGPQGGDEINVIRAGANYGWPEVTFGRAYSGRPIADAGTGPGFESPIHQWTPSIAPSGMAFVTGGRYPDLEGTLLVGALAQRHLRVVALAGTRVTSEVELFRGFARVRDVREGGDGWVYVLTDAADGGLFRLEVIR